MYPVFVTYQVCVCVFSLLIFFCTISFDRMPGCMPPQPVSDKGRHGLHLKQMRRDTNLCWTLLVFCKDFASNQKFLSATSSTRRVFSAQECPVLVQTSICEVKCSGIALPVKLDDYRIQDRNKKNQTDVYNAHFIQKWSRLASHPNLSETTAC